MKNTVERLVRYFTEGVGAYETGATVGIEVETQFIDNAGHPISSVIADRIFRSNFSFWNDDSWNATAMNGTTITEMTRVRGDDKILYELGRHNIELSFSPRSPEVAVNEALIVLERLMIVARGCGAYPFLGPVFESDENLLLIPDERDATWLALDGVMVLNLLARTSSVQFTIDVRPEDAVLVLNKLGENMGMFLSEYPQDALWKKYIAESPAGYKSDRYGGPLFFRNIENYCERLVEHDVVLNNKLVPHEEVMVLNIPLFIRSVWWHFRLKRYGERLCIEIRPLPRGSNESIRAQFSLVQSIINPFL